MVRPEIRPLTSLRFFAASLIVILHGVGILHHSFLQQLFAFAHGVTFFFILSGFILAYSYPALNGAKAIGKFWFARISRIWPATIVSILFWAALLPWGLPDLPLYQKLAVFFTNIFLLHSWIPSATIANSLNSVTWSLSAELLFYLLFPALLYVLKIRWTWILLCLISWIAIHILLMLNVDFVGQKDFFDWLYYFSPTTRLFEFVSGIFAYQLYRRFNTVKGPLLFWTILESGTLLLVIFNLWLCKHLFQLGLFLGDLIPLGLYIKHTGGATPSLFLLVLVFAFNRGWLSMLLSRPSFVLLGRISFALYLVHYPFVNLYKLHLKEFSSSYSSWELNIAYWIVCLGASYLLFTFVEEPCRRVMKRIGDKYIFERSKSSPPAFSPSIPR